MYEEIAWNNFCKTGDLESFLQYKEYKRICNLILKNPDGFESWKIGAKIVRKGRFGNLIIPDKEH